eukprot:g76893.t1
MVLLVFCVLWSAAWAGALVNLDDSNFEEMIKDRDAFVTFFAPWCSECNKFHPVNEQLSEEFADSSLLVAQFDCTLNPTKASELSIEHYPTLRYFRNGVQLEQYKGKRDIASLRQWLYGLNPSLKKETTKAAASPKEADLVESFQTAWSSSILGLTTTQSLLVWVVAKNPLTFIACAISTEVNANEETDVSGVCTSTGGSQAMFTYSCDS